MGEARRKMNAAGLPVFNGGDVAKQSPRLAVFLSDAAFNMIHFSFVQSLLTSDVRLEPNVIWIRTVSPHPDIGMNASVKYALDQGAEELLFLTSDQTVPPDLIKRFRAHNKPIVSALTASRQPGHPWLLFEYTYDGRFVQAEPQTALQRCGYVGPSCMLVKAEVFRKLKAPWFYSTSTADGSGMLITNDFHFFADCAKAGIEVYCDTTVQSEHLHEIWLNARSLGRDLSRIEVAGNFTVKDNVREGVTQPLGMDLSGKNGQEKHCE